MQEDAAALGGSKRIREGVRDSAGGGGDARRPRNAGVRAALPEREFFIDNLLVRIHCIIVMIRWTGLAPWRFEFSFPGSLTPWSFLPSRPGFEQELVTLPYRGTSLIRNSPLPRITIGA